MENAKQMSLDGVHYGSKHTALRKNQRKLNHFSPLWEFKIRNEKMNSFTFSIIVLMEFILLSKNTYSIPIFKWTIALMEIYLCSKIVRWEVMEHNLWE